MAHHGGVAQIFALEQADQVARVGFDGEVAVAAPVRAAVADAVVGDGAAPARRDRVDERPPVVAGAGQPVHHDHGGPPAALDRVHREPVTDVEAPARGR